MQDRDRRVGDHAFTNRDMHDVAFSCTKFYAFIHLAKHLRRIVRCPAVGIFDHYLIRRSAFRNAICLRARLEMVVTRALLSRSGT